MSTTSEPKLLAAMSTFMSSFLLVPPTVPGWQGQRCPQCAQGEMVARQRACGQALEELGGGRKELVTEYKTQTAPPAYLHLFILQTHNSYCFESKLLVPH
jgi:hypothetical protein